MKKFAKSMSIMLLLALLLLLAAACNTKGGEGSGNERIDPEAENSAGQPGDSEEPAEPKLDVVSVLATLPEADYENYQFDIWTSNWFNATLEGRQAPDEEETGDIVNDALFRRDRLVEEKYNIEIVYTITDDVNSLLSKSKNSINAGDDAFDYGMDNLIIYASGLAGSGLLTDFGKLPNINLDNEWWSQYARRDLTIDGRFFFPTGDISARYPGSQYLMLFNKKLFLDMGLEYPYQSVLEGNWTLEALFELTKYGTLDLNGDGELNKNDDRFGCFVESIGSISFLHSCGGRLTKIVDGNPVFDVRNDRTIDVIDRLTAAWGDTYQIYYPKNYATYDEVSVFKEDRALFAAMTGTNTALYKDMESEFGIVPLPKYEASQADYYSYCQPWGSAAVCVPITVPNLERTGMIIEAMAASGKYTSTIAVYDVTFKIKYARDEESSQMLDIICDGSVYDFAHIYNWGTVYDSFGTTIAKGDSFLTKFDSLEGKAQAAMEKTIDAFVGIG